MTKGRKQTLAFFVLFLGFGAAMWIRGRTGSVPAFWVAMLCSAVFGYRLAVTEETVDE